MPEATFLQIHGRGNVPMRMLELPPGSVRIGRGAHCEVRLAEPALSDVQCMLRRRGNTWHFQPVGPPGQVWIDGRPADQQRPMPLGVPFRVGESWLTLRPADSAHNDWGSYDAPITVESEGFTPSDPAPEPAQVEPIGQTAAAPPSPDDNEERLRRWQARLDQRERWNKDRQDEKRWEARWKSAGESLKGRSAPASTPPTRPATSRPTPTPTPPPRPIQAPPVARIIEPKRPEPLRRVAEPAPRPASARVPIRPIPAPTAPIARTVEPPKARVPIKPVPIEKPPVAKVEPTPISRALVTLPSIPAHWLPPVELVAPTPLAEPETAEIEARTPAEEIAVAEPEPAILVRAEDERPSLLSSDPDFGVTGVCVTPQPRDTDPSLVETPGLDDIDRRGCGVPQTPANRHLNVTVGEPVEEAISAVAPSIESSDWIEELPASTALADWTPEPEQASEVVPGPTEPEVVPTRWTEPPALEPVAAPGARKTEFPTARAIFEAQGRRPQSAPEVAKPRRRRSVEPEPTDALAPKQWSLPLWLGWLPVVAMVLVVGLGGIALSYEWAVDANAANQAIRYALRTDTKSPAPVDPASIPRGSWWRSNAPHLAAWAMALERSGDGEDHNEEIRSLIDAAEGASHFAARTRFVLDPPDSTEPGATTELAKLGRPRDVVTLVWTARRHFKAGKLDASLRAYRSAIEIAAKAGRDDLDEPVFDDDTQVKRYALPRESLLGLAIRDMAEAADWTAEQWTEALPPSALASMVASRALAKKQKRSEADRLEDLAIRQAETPPAGFDAAENRAAGAEALAARGRWTDAAEQYRLAIDQVEDDATRRMWWLNLAEVAHRLGDDPARARAIEAAKTTDAMDKITRRALEYQQLLPGLASSTPRR